MPKPVDEIVNTLKKASIHIENNDFKGYKRIVFTIPREDASEITNAELMQAAEKLLGR